MLTETTHLPEGDPYTVEAAGVKVRLLKAGEIAMIRAHQEEKVTYQMNPETVIAFTILVHHQEAAAAHLDIIPALQEAAVHQGAAVGIPVHLEVVVVGIQAHPEVVLPTQGRHHLVRLHPVVHHQEVEAEGVHKEVEDSYRTS